MKTTQPKKREANTNKIKGSPNGDTLDGDFIENLKISNDPTYGYSPNNPIKVANSSASGMGTGQRVSIKATV